MASSRNAQITVAVISLVGVLGTAIFANWDKLFPPDEGQPTSTDQASNQLGTESVEQPEGQSSPASETLTEPEKKPEIQEAIHIQTVNTKSPDLHRFS